MTDVSKEKRPLGDVLEEVVKAARSDILDGMGIVEANGFEFVAKAIANGVKISWKRLKVEGAAIVAGVATEAPAEAPKPKA